MVNTRPVVTALVVCLLGTLGLVAKPASSNVKQAAAKARTATRVSSARSLAAKKHPSGKAVYRKPAPRTVTSPAVPTSNRLRDVQVALIEKGYLQGDVNGIWNAQCVDALKRFEGDQKVKVDGKIDSKMLIALGLGPKYDTDLNAPSSFSGTSTVVSADQLNNTEPRN